MTGRLGKKLVVKTHHLLAIEKIVQRHIALRQVGTKGAVFSRMDHGLHGVRPRL